MPAPVALACLCRDCLHVWTLPAGPETGMVADGMLPRCPDCGFRRTVAHRELGSLDLAHIDCDSFYAAVEKRDRPELKDRPLLIGGTGRRGVVATACYVARRFGCRSAMPMAQARALCPQAVVLPPDMARYKRASEEIRAILRACTPLIEPVSVDEAYLDLSARDDPAPLAGAVALADAALRVEQEVGITVSVGFSYNKFLAKLASDRDKPRGFAVIGRAEARSLLAPLPVRAIHGVGPAMERRLVGDGFQTIGALQRASEHDLVLRYGSHGRSLWHLARGEDARRVTPVRPVRSVSAETTFAEDQRSPEVLLAALEPLAARVAERLERTGLAAGGVQVKLKTASFRLLTRHARLGEPTRRAAALLAAAAPLVRREADGRSFRLVGIGADALAPAAAADQPDLFA